MSDGRVGSHVQCTSHTSALEWVPNDQGVSMADHGKSPGPRAVREGASSRAVYLTERARRSHAQGIVGGLSAGSMGRAVHKKGM
jgi:hypothetical protein